MCVSTYSPLILHETCEGIQRFDVRDQMLADRQIELAGPIDASSVACAARRLLASARRPVWRRCCSSQETDATCCPTAAS